MKNFSILRKLRRYNAVLIASLFLVCYFFDTNLRRLENKTDVSTHFWLHAYLKHGIHSSVFNHRKSLCITSTAGIGDIFYGIVNSYGYAVLSKRFWMLNLNEKDRFDLLMSEKSKRRFLYSGKEANSQNSSGNMILWKSTKNGGAKFAVDVLNSDIENVSTFFTHWYSPTQYIDVFKKVHWKDESSIPPFTLRAKRAVTQAIFEPSALLQNRLEEAMKRLNLCPSYSSSDNSFNRFKDILNCGFFRKPYIGIHARIGLGVGEEKDPRFIDIQQRLDKVAACLCERLISVMFHSKNNGPRIKRIYFATDTESFRGVFYRTIMQKIPDAKIYFLSDNPRHTKARAKVATEHIISTHVENLLLANARHIIAFRSGYAEAAFFRGNAISYSTATYAKCKGLETCKPGLHRTISKQGKYSIFERDGNKEFTLFI